MPPFDLTGSRVGIRRSLLSDGDEFIALVQSSQDLHQPWIDAPSTLERYDEYIKSRHETMNDGFLICDKSSGQIVGVVNLNCIVRGLFQSAYLGYYVGAAFANRGYMTEGITLVARYAFTQMGLHRLEANIEPGNIASIALARKCGFRKEGFSPRYLRIAGQWQDHERWALLADDGGR
jgi:[ribosomal protein S5]-alanine N-acetyltransferase